MYSTVSIFASIWLFLANMVLAAPVSSFGKRQNEESDTKMVLGVRQNVVILFVCTFVCGFVGNVILFICVCWCGNDKGCIPSCCGGKTSDEQKTSVASSSVHSPAPRSVRRLVVEHVQQSETESVHSLAPRSVHRLVVERVQQTQYSASSSSKSSSSRSGSSSGNPGSSSKKPVPTRESFYVPQLNWASSSSQSSSKNSGSSNESQDVYIPTVEL